MFQHVVQLPTFGVNVAAHLNSLLRKNPEWKLSDVKSIEVARNGGPDNHVLAVFEAPVEALHEFKEGD